MNQDEFITELEKTFKNCLEIVKKKNTDYADKHNDAFRNFRFVEIFGICETGDGILTRITDKFARIINLRNKPPAVVTETIEDTINDLINYLGIYKTFIKNKEDK